MIRNYFIKAIEYTLAYFVDYTKLVLIYKLLFATKFKRITGNCRRYVQFDLGEQIVLKDHRSKKYLIYRPLVDDDVLAYKLDLVLGFNVVPPTYLLSELNVFYRCIFYVFGILNLNNLYDEDTIVQAYKPKDESGNTGNCRFEDALFFSIICGKTDGRDENSIISDGKIYEIDNEQIGHNKTDTWMFRTFCDIYLDQKYINNFLKENKLNDLKDLLKDYDTYYWNLDEPYGFTIKSQLKTNVLNNYEKLFRFLNNNKDKNIKVSDLNIFYSLTK